MTIKEFAIRILKEVPSVTTLTVSPIRMAHDLPGVIGAWFSDRFKISIQAQYQDESENPYKYRYVLMRKNTLDVIFEGYGDEESVIRFMNEHETPATPDNQPSE